MTYRGTLFLLSQIRKLSTSNGLWASKNHYDSLGLTKNATQADVKAAYYNLSKVYHPDRNQGHTAGQREEHSQKFRDITEAYEVLGNVKTRRMYDKGFLSRDHASRPSQEDPLHKFYKSREVRNRPPPPGGRTPIYDFDEWSKRHYGEAFRRSQEMKHRHAFHERMREDDKNFEKYEIFLWIPLVVVLLYGLKQLQNVQFNVEFLQISRLREIDLLQVIVTPDYDKPLPSQRKHNIDTKSDFKNEMEQRNSTADFKT